MGNPVKIPPATLAILDAARAACQPVVDKIDAAQEAHATGKRAKHFQLRPCFKGTPPLDGKAVTIDAVTKAEPSPGVGLVEVVADGVNAKGQPKSKQVVKPEPTWAEVLKGEDPAIPCDVRVDEYDGPGGVGYFTTFTTVVDGVRYEASEDRGPDGGFAREWAEVPQAKG